MTARNPITGDLIKTKGGNDAYRAGWDAIFKKTEAAIVPEEIIEATEAEPRYTEHDGRNRYVGSLVGLAIGDAIGTTVEFRYREEIETPLTDIVGGGPFNLLPGQWTDDTSMALCLAESLIEKKGHDPHDQLQRYVNWYSYGYNSSNGRCFDIGNTTRLALDKYIDNPSDPYPGLTDEQASGNGGLMRLAPAVLYYWPNSNKVIEMAGQSSRTTHAGQKPVECAKLLACVIGNALAGLKKQDVLTNLQFIPSNDEVRDIYFGTYRTKTVDEIFGTGYCVKSLEAALYCFYKSESFEECVLMAANLGNDADTTAAIAGQIAGAFYGFNSIREDWVKKITWSDTIIDLGERLYTKQKV